MICNIPLLDPASLRTKLCLCEVLFVKRRFYSALLLLFSSLESAIMYIRIRDNADFLFYNKVSFLL